MDTTLQQVAERRLMTTAEAAKRLGYTIQHVRRLVLAGKLDGAKHGRDWLVVAWSVEAFIAKSEYLSLPLGPNESRQEGGT